MKSMNVNHSDNFNTPDHIFGQLNNVFNFTIDVACTSKNQKCPEGFCFDKGEDGFDYPWGRERAFCNPPFSQKKKWIEKAINEVEFCGCSVCVMILPLNCMSTSFFYDLVIKRGYRYEILKGRIQFLDDKTKKPAKGNNSGTVIVYFTKKIRV